MTRLTGQQARELLGVCPPWDHVKIAQTVDLDHGPDRAVLAASAHDLAETIAWLYGRESDDEAVWDDKYEVSVMADGRVAVFDQEATITFFTPDETVEFARALLVAAEEARRG